MWAYAAVASCHVQSLQQFGIRDAYERFLNAGGRHFGAKVESKCVFASLGKCFTKCL